MNSNKQAKKQNINIEAPALGTVGHQAKLTPPQWLRWAEIHQSHTGYRRFHTLDP